MIKQYQCVIFDWDGTLMDSEARIVASIQAAAKQVDFPVLSHEVSKQIIGLSLEKAILTLYPEASEEAVKLMVTGYAECFLKESQVSMMPFAGAEDVLQSLKSAGVKLAVATGKSRRGLDHVLAELAYADYFDLTRTPVEAESKPSPLMLQQILSALNLTVDQAVMIGDTEFDMQMAQAIGMDRIALSHGVHDLPLLQAYEPIATFDDLMALQAWLKSRVVPYQVMAS